LSNSNNWISLSTDTGGVGMELRRLECCTTSSKPSTFEKYQGIIMKLNEEMTCVVEDIYIFVRV
jgi:hypothetical protein